MKDGESGRVQVVVWGRDGVKVQNAGVSEKGKNAQRIGESDRGSAPRAGPAVTLTRSPSKHLKAAFVCTRLVRSRCDYGPEFMLSIT